MTRPFTPRDALRLRQEQAAGTALELETTVLVSQSPLRQAVTSLLRVGASGVRTYVLSLPDGAGGFLQARKRAHAPEADTTFIAPALSARDGAALYWSRMIGESCQHLAAEGIQRVFVAVDENDRVALQLFQQVGFRVFAGDTVFQRAPAPSSGRLEMPVSSNPAHPNPARPDPALRIRPAIDADAPAITACHRASLPPRVRAEEWGSERGAPVASNANSTAGSNSASGERAGSEGGQDACWGHYPVGGHGADGRAAWVGIGERGVVLCAARCVFGRKGDWLQIVSVDEVDFAPLVRYVLDQVRGEGGAGSGQPPDGAAPGAGLAGQRQGIARGLVSGRPLYATARGYESQLNLVLRDCGFRPVVGRFRMVKHTAVRILEPSWSTQLVAESSLETVPMNTAPTQFHSSTR